MSYLLIFSSIILASFFQSNLLVECLSQNVNTLALNTSVSESSSLISEGEEYEINELDFLRAIIKYGSNAITVFPMLNDTNYFGSCLIEGIPKISNSTRLIGQYIIKFTAESEEDCWCKCMGFEGCFASLYAWKTCHLYDYNYREITENGFTAYTRRNKVKYSYIGCFADKVTRDLSYLAYFEYIRNSNDYCAYVCDSYGYLYFGTQAGGECYCGNSYGRYGFSNNCNVTCTGNTSETCGGSWAISVSKIIK